MNLIPIEIYYFLSILLPLGACFWKWRYAMTWLFATLVCAVSSWLFFMLELQVFDIGANGLVTGFYAWTGWFWLLPIFAVFACVFKTLERRMALAPRKKWGRWGYLTCASLTGLILIWNLFGRMSESRALLEARRVIERQKLKAVGPALPEYADGRWTIRYPESAFKAIVLSRNGRLMGIGG